MITMKPIRNVYCSDKEDTVVPHSCECCTKCWVFVTSKDNMKNGKCPYNGPFRGFYDELHSEEKEQVLGSTGEPDKSNNQNVSTEEISQ